MPTLSRKRSGLPRHQVFPDLSLVRFLCSVLKLCVLRLQEYSLVPRDNTCSENEGRTLSGEVRCCALVKKPLFVGVIDRRAASHFPSIVLARQVCAHCSRATVDCPHFPELPLRLLLVGHNPSQKAWEQGYYYANISQNAMMRLLRGNVKHPHPLPAHQSRLDSFGLIPPWFALQDQDQMPLSVGVGLVDVIPEVRRNAVRAGNGATRELDPTKTVCFD